MRLIVLTPIMGLWLLAGCGGPATADTENSQNDLAAEHGEQPVDAPATDTASEDGPASGSQNDAESGSLAGDIGSTGGSEVGGGMSGSGDAVIDEEPVDGPIEGEVPEESPEQTPGLVVQNFSNFQQFRCVQRSVIVPCLPEGSIYEAVVTRQSYNEYLAEISVVQQGVIGQDECINSPATYVCVTAAPLEPRLLEADEIDDVQAAFRAVQVDWDSAPGCNPNDTCGVTAFSWDSSEVDDSCEAPRLRAEQAQVIGDLLEQLRSGWPATAPQPPQAPASGL